MLRQCLFCFSAYNLFAFLSKLPAGKKIYDEDYMDEIPNKSRAWISCVSSTEFEFTYSYNDYEDTLAKLDDIYIKTQNEMLAQHLLTASKNKLDET